MIDWERLLTSTPNSATSRFGSDWDTLIFSAPFRRLQNKTQVFPLPGSIFVHNRLTHSLEVASVGRALARLAMEQAERPDLAHRAAETVAAACLAHDIGNPPFGHAGERAIGAFFAEGEGAEFRATVVQELGEQRGHIFWTDLCCFDGNAAGLHLLLAQYGAARWGGQPLSEPLLASTVKYPHSSTLSTAPHKFGFFLADTPHYQTIAHHLGLTSPQQGGTGGASSLRVARHPLSYLVEAADDICYQIMDLDDAVKLGIVSQSERAELLRALLPPKTVAQPSSIAAINSLICEAARLWAHRVEDETLPQCRSLIEDMQQPMQGAWAAISTVARSRIYKVQAVLDVEMAGYHIITTLLSRLTRAAVEPQKAESQILIERVPPQYGILSQSPSERIFAAVDYIAGMTDVYALDLYRKILGLQLPSI